MCSGSKEKEEIRKLSAKVEKVQLLRCGAQTVNFMIYFILRRNSTGSEEQRKRHAGKQRSSQEGEKKMICVKGKGDCLTFAGRRG